MLNWYINRLKTMSLLEIAYRFKQLFQKKIESKFFMGKSLKNLKVPKTKSLLQIGELKVALFDNEFSVFGKTLNFYDNKINWHKDVFSEELYSKTFQQKMFGR